MRNLLEHPVTTAEIIDVLQHYIAEEETRKQVDDPPIGSPTAIVLEEAIRRIWSVQDWYVSRTDDNGNSEEPGAGRPLIVRSGMSESAARALYALFVRRGHKQTYSIQQEQAGQKVT
jgi:hypothetical protein